MTLRVLLSSIVGLRVFVIPALNAASGIGSVGPIIVRDSLPPALASITTDTGDLASGHRDFTSYDSPEACLEAGHTALGYDERTERARVTADSLRRTAPDRDTLPSSVVALVRRCGMRFLTVPLVTVPSTTLPALFELALWAQQDSMAQAILTHQLATVGSDTARRRLLGEGIDSLLQTRPARVAAVEALAAKVDAQGSTAVFEQYDVHQQLLTFATQHFDRGRMRREADLLMRIDPHLGPADTALTRRFFWRRISAYGALYQLLAVDYPDSLPMFAQRILEDLHRPIWQRARLVNYKYRVDKILAMQKAQTDSILKMFFNGPGKGTGITGIIDPLRPTPRLEARYWMSPAGDTIQPVPGKVSLFVRPLLSCFDDPLWDPGWDNGCTAEMHTLARLVEQYRPLGLRITIVTWIQGHALYSGPLTPAAEARAIAWYFQTFKGLPVTVAVQAPVVLQRLGPFPIVIWDTANVNRQYGQPTNAYYDSWAALTDRAGQLRYVGSDTSAVLDAVLTTLLPRASARAVLPQH